VSISKKFAISGNCQIKKSMILNIKMKVLFAKFTGFYTFASVKVRHSYECLTSGKDFKSPMGDGSVHLNSSGLLFLRHAVRAKLWFTRSLVQVNSLLDKRKPSRRLIFFIGVFFFCFPLFKVLNTFCFLLFSFEQTPYYG
jgi:hypothetical protein